MAKIKHFLSLIFPFLLLAHYVPNIAKRSAWEQCIYWRLTTDRPTDLPFWKTLNGHISAMGQCISGIKKHVILYKLLVLHDNRILRLRKWLIMAVWKPFGFVLIGRWKNPNPAWEQGLSNSACHNYVKKSVPHFYPKMYLTFTISEICLDCSIRLLCMFFLSHC